MSVSTTHIVITLLSSPETYTAGQNLEELCPNIAQTVSKTMEIRNLSKLLARAAEDACGGTVTVHSPDVEYGLTLTYQCLFALAKRKSIQLERKFGSINSRVVLIYFHDHLNSIVWFWAIVLAGGVPCICPPLPGNLELRLHQVINLQALLENPPVITTKALALEFPSLENLQVVLIDDIESINGDCPPTSSSVQGYKKIEQDLAVLMLTSGSTGYPKAVCLNHGQIMCSVGAKSIHHATKKQDVFLNWIGLDHVANLVEIHLHAISLAAPQIHIQSSVILADPMCFLKRLASHKVTYTFAPNFFLAMLVQALSSHDETYCRENEQHLVGSSSDVPNGINGSSIAIQDAQNSPAPFDLSSLRALISGGESNVVDTCGNLARRLNQYGASECLIRPGFGMTETCAGSIYNALDCPSYDIAQRTEFCSVGECIQGIQAKITQPDGTECSVNEIGSLEVSGPIVFSGYYHDEKSTRQAFTDQGWFRTGDLGYLDENGRLMLTGRAKDTIVINGVNHSSQAIEAAIEEAAISEVTPSFTVAFAYRAKDSATECLCIAYLPSPASNKAQQGRSKAAIEISKAVVKYCGARPYKILALPATILQKSSLGKLPRLKIRRAFEDGAYNGYEVDDQKAMQQSSDIWDFQRSPTQRIIMQHLSAILDVSLSSLVISSDLFGLGISSIDLLKLRARLQECLEIEIPVTIFFSSPVIRDLGQSLDALCKKKEYNPITTLQAGGSKAPLFIIHPGMGDVLIFMNLARYITDRPVYALRARGFDGEETFSSMDEMSTEYHEAIKRMQPTGPYAIAGYLFGSVVAFEVAKMLEAGGNTVQFLATIDQPPHLKLRAAMYDWYQTVVTISFFMGLITEDYAYASLPTMREKSHEEVLDHILGLADPDLLDQIGMTRGRLENWADLAYKLKVIAREYDPAGVVAKMHVFYTRPRTTAFGVQSEAQWFDQHISKWRDHARAVTFHKVDGKHTTSISPPNVLGFQKLLKAIMKEDGL